MKSIRHGLGAVAALAIMATIGAVGVVPPPAQAVENVELTLSATIDSAGTITVNVSAPGCQTTPPENFPEIFIQSRNPTTGEVGEGAVAVGGFTTPGHGSAVIPAGTPVNSFVANVTCNGGALRGSQAFTVGAPATPVPSQPVFTG